MSKSIFEQLKQQQQALYYPAGALIDPDMPGGGRIQSDGSIAPLDGEDQEAAVMGDMNKLTVEDDPPQYVSSGDEVDHDKVTDDVEGKEDWEDEELASVSQVGSTASVTAELLALSEKKRIEDERKFAEEALKKVHAMQCIFMLFINVCLFNF
jgi:hypothetical protein